MAWDTQRSETRIQEYLKTVPSIEGNITLAQHRALLREDIAKASIQDEFPRGRALLVSGVHLYGVLLDFDDLVVDGDEETESSHARVLRFLNAHFRVWDAIVDDDAAMRVDYHGPRLHAVVTEPIGDEAGQIARAVALAEKLSEAAKRVGDSYEFPSRIRFGIDAGMCLGMSTGRSIERDVLFLGSPANHAAKLAEAEAVDGIFLTDNAQAKLASGSLQKTELGTMELSESFRATARQNFQFSSVEKATATVVEDAGRDPKFNFFRPIPPLYDLKFKDLKPSRSARIESASLFADIHGFTAYIDQAIVDGEQAIRDAVSCIHVLREELNSVLQDDFNGKRVRFIGDCIQGLLAEGRTQDSPSASVKQSCLCASGMRSSFLLSQQILGSIDQLDLAIGIEYGPVPITRIGKQGAESIRCAAGRAVIQSERYQRQIAEGGINIGPVARRWAPANVSESYQDFGKILTYSSAVDLLEMPDSPVAARVHVNRDARPHSEASDR